MTYVFVDLETTGLDPNLSDILEVGIVVYDKNFNKLGVFSEVAHYRHPDKNPSTWIDPFVVQMHTKNGLWDECDASQHSLRQVELDAIEFLKAGGWVRQPLAGSTINFDRSFLQRHMLKLHDTFHYRNIDVSSFKNVWKMYDMPELRANEKKEAHRAIPDCEESAMALLAMLTELEFPLNVATPKF